MTNIDYCPQDAMFAAIPRHIEPQVPNREPKETWRTIDPREKAAHPRALLIIHHSSFPRHTVTDSGISALWLTACTSSLSSSASTSFNTFCAVSASTGTVLLGMLVISEASTGTLAAP